MPQDNKSHWYQDRSTSDAWPQEYKDYLVGLCGMVGEGFSKENDRWRTTTQNNGGIGYYTIERAAKRYLELACIPHDEAEQFNANTRS